MTITDSFRRLPLDVVPKVIRFLLYTQKKLEDKNYTKIIAFDETAVWFDAVGSTTVDRVGVEDVPIECLTKCHRWFSLLSRRF